jgi:hypothetical protein
MQKIVLLTGVLLFLLFGFSVSAVACDKGCTPGYWKQEQHWDSWGSYFPEQEFDDVFTCDSTGEMTLVDALKGKGGGLYALRRHAVASLLNADAFCCFDGGTPQNVINAYCAALSSAMSIEDQKDRFANDNEQNCPLD